MIEQLDPMPARSQSGKRNLDLFLAGTKAHPVCFYFEDAGSEELYSRFLNRLFPKHDNPLVVCTGGKSKATLKQAKDQNIGPVVIVHDKDFSDLIGKIPDEPQILTLNRYSFENYLFDPTALIELAIELKRHKRKAEVSQILDLSSYFLNTNAQYLKLVSLFVMSQKWNLKKISTTKQSISEIIGKDKSAISDDDVALYASKVKAAAFREQKIASDEEFDEHLSKALIPQEKFKDHADSQPCSHYCGKHLLDLVLLHIYEKLEIDEPVLDRYQASMRFVQNVPLAVFSRVRQSIVISLRAQTAEQHVLSMFE